MGRPVQGPQHLIAQQYTGLVTAQHPPAVVAGRDADRTAVGIRIVGDCQVGVHLGGQREKQVRRTRLFGVRKGDRREVGVRHSLGSDDVDVGETGQRERMDKWFAAHAVHGGGRDPQRSRCPTSLRGRPRQIGRDQIVRPGLGCARGVHPEPAGSTAAIAASMAASTGATMRAPACR